MGDQDHGGSAVKHHIKHNDPPKYYPSHDRKPEPEPYQPSYAVGLVSLLFMVACAVGFWLSVVWVTVRVAKLAWEG